jgi:uncharacterized protein (TIRG00374 family)
MMEPANNLRLNPALSLSSSKWRRWVTLNGWAGRRRFWLGVACSALFLYLAIGKVHWEELQAALQAVDWRYLLLATVVFMLRLLIGGLRWRALVLPLGSLSVREAFSYLNIGHMANNLLPLRAGEIVRAVLVGDRKGFSKTAVFATIVADRLLEVLALVAYAVLLMLIMPIPPLVKQSALVFGSVGVLVGMGLWWAAGHVFPAAPQTSPHASDTALPSRRRQWVGLLQKVSRQARGFASGLTALRSPGQVGAALGYSTLGWGLSVGFTWLVLQACHVDLPWTAALMVIVVVNFGAAIPSAPGFIGVMHFLVVIALKPWTLGQSAALAFALVYHAQSFLLTVGLGITCLIWERRSVPALSSELSTLRRNTVEAMSRGTSAS